MAWIKDWVKQIRTNSIQLMVSESANRGINSYNETIKNTQNYLTDLRTLWEDIKLTKCAGTPTDLPSDPSSQVMSSSGRSILDALAKEFRDCRRTRKSNSSFSIFAQNPSFKTTFLVFIAIITIN